MNKNNPHISFYVFRKDGSRNPEILRSFLEEREISAYDAAQGIIQQVDGSKFTLILEDELSTKLKEQRSISEPVKCIISFQLRRNGAYAVARLWKPKEKKV